MTNHSKLSSANTGQAERKTIFTYTLMRLYLAVLILLVAPVFVPYLQQTSLNTLALIVLIICIVLFVTVVQMTPQGIWSASSVYLLIFCMFHFGAVIPLALGFVPSHELQHSLSRWFDRSYTHTATLLALLGVFTYAIGVHGAFLLKKKGDQDRESNIEEVRKSLALSGFVLLLSGIIIWFVIVFSSGGLGLVFGSYRDYLDFAALPSVGYISYAYFAIGLGFPLLVSTPPSRIKHGGIILFSLWSVIAVPLGLRGEVLFPLATTGIILARQRTFSTSIGRAVLIGIIVLLLITAVRQVRQVGMSQYSALTEVRLDPVDSLVEMGSSLRPVTEVLVWEAAGEEYIMGSSYWAPLERFIRRIIPGIPRIPAEQDNRLMNILVQKRVGPIGFSPIAEAYRNFGYIGVGLFMLLIGFVMGKLDQWPTNSVRDAYLAVILVPFLIQIRNDFTPIPFQLLTGFFVVRFAVMIGYMTYTKTKSRSSYQYLRQFRAN